MPLSKEQMKIYRQNNKEKLKEKADKWKLENRDKILESKKLYRDSNREFLKKDHADRWQRNKDYYNEAKKNWMENNKERYAKTRQKRKAKRQYGEYYEAQIIKLELIECLKKNLST